MKKHYYTIGEVSNLLGEKPHVIRYWESEFSFLRPRREKGRIRKYTRENVELLRRIQDMLHNQRFTIEGARLKLKEERRRIRAGEIPKPPPVSQQVSPETTRVLTELRSRLEEIRTTCRRVREYKK